MNTPNQSRIPASVIVAAAVLMALPFGWGLGVFAAYLLAGSNFGQLPVATVPIGILAAVAFAFWPSFTPITRLKVTFGGTVAFALVGWLLV
jgi:hypothetical protein